MTLIASAKPLASYAAESGHWYQRDGTPAYRIIGANGKERATTLRDARPRGWVPGTTTVTKCAYKPGLEHWKAEQLLLSALTLPRLPAEAEADWISRVWDDSIQQVIKAAERGTEIHAAVEASLAGRPFNPELQPFVDAAMEAIRPLDPLGVRTYQAEKSFASSLGYGGKVDLHCPWAVLDFKTKDGDIYDARCYDEHFMQLAAYANGVGYPEARCGNVFISRQLPAVARLVMHTEEQTATGWRMFQALLRYWQEANEYSPVWS